MRETDLVNRESFTVSSKCRKLFITVSSVNDSLKKGPTGAYNFKENVKYKEKGLNKKEIVYSNKRDKI